MDIYHKNSDSHNMTVSLHLWKRGCRMKNIASCTRLHNVFNIVHILAQDCINDFKLSRLESWRLSNPSSDTKSRLRRRGRERTTTTTEKATSFPRNLSKYQKNKMNLWEAMTTYIQKGHKKKHPHQEVFMPQITS